MRPNESYTACEVSFEGGDRLLLYSDDLVESEDSNGESFGDAALPNFIQEKRSLGAEQFVDQLLKNVLAWSRSRSTKGRRDDITIVVVDMEDGSKSHREKLQQNIGLCIVAETGRTELSQAVFHGETTVLLTCSRA